MANLLDDLKGLLSPEEFAKIEANPALKTRAAKAAELLDWYGGEEPEPVADPAKKVEPEPVRRSAPNFDLSAIETMLDKKLGSINTTIETKINETVQKRGDELVNNAVKIALQRSDELNRIYMEHQSNYGEAFDTTKFNEFLEANKDKGFRTIRQGYDEYVKPRAIEREVDTKVKAKLAEESGKHVPGTTPAPSVNSNIMHFKKRALAGDGQGTTGAQRAAAMLDRMSAEKSA